MKSKIKRLQNTLVRDNIPDHLAAAGVECEVEEIKDEVRYVRLLLDNLVEEAQAASETFDDETLLIELADVESTIDSLLIAKGLTRAQLQTEQDKSDGENGKFTKKLFLHSITEELAENTGEETEDDPTS